MKVEEIREDDEQNGAELLAILVSAGEGYPTGLHYLTNPGETLQAAVMRRPAGERIGPFRYNPLIRPREQSPTQSALVLLSGLVKVDLYDTRDRLRTSRRMVPGDVLLTLAGGHCFEMLMESELVEVKHGPYPGRETEKSGFEPRDD